ncbi:VQ motif containing protein [Melia azedarach]|uniref:VQ motif containing protein n=1 Tax=Melia azedarach TaxID=155640 RepID=A0ACC1XF70_MELAZ|nr:VQ motif containing protein [Melia azedarach]
MSPARFHDDDDLERSRIINGPRPSPLKIGKDSHVIHKSHSSSSSSTSAPGLAQQKQQRQPVIIYAHSPKVIHTQARDFMALVQKLTGLSPPVEHDRHDNNNNNNNKTAGMSTMKKEKTVDGKHDCGVGGADGTGVSLSSVSPITRPPTNPFLADIPLFTPTGTDFFFSPKPMYRFPGSPNTGNPISPSVFEFMKGLPDY